MDGSVGASSQQEGLARYGPRSAPLLSSRYPSPSANVMFRHLRICISGPPGSPHDVRHMTKVGAWSCSIEATALALKVAWRYPVPRAGAAGEPTSQGVRAGSIALRRSGGARPPGRKESGDVRTRARAAGARSPISQSLALRQQEARAAPCLVIEDAGRPVPSTFRMLDTEVARSRIHGPPTSPRSQPAAHRQGAVHPSWPAGCPCHDGVSSLAAARRAGARAITPSSVLHR